MNSVKSFISYWWFRWTLVSEMYMVEKWERISINIMFLVLFLGFWYFNFKVILSVVGAVVQWLTSVPTSHVITDFHHTIPPVLVSQ